MSGPVDGETGAAPCAERGCPLCGNGRRSVFYRQRGVPVHSARLFRTREAAVACARGDIVLAVCAACGFVGNTAFAAGTQDFAPGYEGAQSFSSAYRAFARWQARALVRDYHLHRRRIVEIGCGQGEFLRLLCEEGANHGTGFDPALDPARAARADRGDLCLVPRVFTCEPGTLRADLVCCRMTLEHIAEPRAFVERVGATVFPGDTPVFFVQVPDAGRILREGAFWDVYYEHCCYFNAAALGALFRACGWDLLRTRTVYGGQYLTLEARRSVRNARPVGAGRDAEAGRRARSFERRAGQGAAAWRERLAAARAGGRGTVLWGAGSKAVAFLQALGPEAVVAAVVDINPYRQDTFVPGTGHRIIAPRALTRQPPGLVVVMNPVYRAEIEAELAELGLRAEVACLPC